MIRMENNKAILYGIIGLLAGSLITVIIASSSVNTQNIGMMRMMGIGTQNYRGSMMENIDEHFIEQMIPHHEDAITMADIAQTKAQHSEIKKLSENIKKTQSEEITQMKNWYNSWYGQDVPEDTSDDANSGAGMMGGRMHGGMMGDESDIATLKNADNFDKAFIEEMIPHHQMAVMMATMLKRGTNREEMRQLAQNIIDAQTKEINEMRQWYKNWGY